MSKVAELLQRVEDAGGRLTLDGDQLVLDAPEDFPDDIVEFLRQHKEELRTHYTMVETLLGWATELAEQDLKLASPVSYVEVPPRIVTTVRASYYALRYLRTIVSARNYQQHRKHCWGRWTQEWWHEREMESVSALAALREAMGQAEELNQGDIT